MITRHSPPNRRPLGLGLVARLLTALLLVTALVSESVAKKKDAAPPAPPAPVVEAPTPPPPPPAKPEPSEPTPTQNLKLEQLLSLKNLPPPDSSSRGERSRVIYPD